MAGKEQLTVIEIIHSKRVTGLFLC